MAAVQVVMESTGQAFGRAVAGAREREVKGERVCMRERERACRWKDK